MNKILFPIIYILIFVFSIFSGPAFSQYNQKEITCGFIVTHMALSPTAIIQGIKPFADYMTEQLGVQVKVELFTDDQAMIKALDEGAVHIGYVSNLDYIKIKEKRDIKPFAKVVKGGSSNYNAILLVRKDSGITCLKDLKGKCFSYTSKNSSHGYLFPSLLVKTNFNQSLENFFVKTIKTKKDPDGILSVLYKKTDAVGASSQTFAIISELMPRLKRDLKVISESEPFVHGPMFTYDRNFQDKRLIERVKQEIINMGKSAKGKQVLLLFKIGGWTTASDSDYNTLRSLNSKL